VFLAEFVDVPGRWFEYLLKFGETGRAPAAGLATGGIEPTALAQPTAEAE
jgi:hypothetical protein